MRGEVTPGEATPLRAAVFGSPIAHSLSPVLHRAGYAALGLTRWRYDRREVTADRLTDVVGDLGAEWRGLSLTMPLKEAAFAVAASVSEVARRAGAINTLVRRGDGAWDATNTDVAGIVAALRGVEHDGCGCVLGSGATARSAVLALAELGVREVSIAARNRQTAADAVLLGGSLGMRARALPLADWVQDPARLVISTVPPTASATVGGLLEAPGGGPFREMTLLDVGYADWPTPLARAVLAHGGAVVSGLDMLVHQAAAQFALFTGYAAPVEALMAAGRAALGRSADLP